jgi:GNAT superfamily N-acetyltransferase
LKITPIIKSVSVPITERSLEIAGAFDFTPDGFYEFSTPGFEVPDDWGCGLIVGPSGSGKSTILKAFGEPVDYEWRDGVALIDHFASASDAANRLMAAGLNSIPKWMLPFSCLSEGEKARANLAYGIQSGAVFDEFTSSVNREAARSMSHAISRAIVNTGLRRVVFASCHYDVEDWLRPDWVIDTTAGRVRPRRSERRPKIELDLLPCGCEAWAAFRAHHYLSGDISRSARCWLAVMNGEAVGFVGVLAFPNGHFKNAWREHRLVIMPDYQGHGLGMRISDAVGAIITAAGGRYFSKTAHPRIRDYRDKSALWVGTSKNGRARPDYVPHLKTKEDGHKAKHAQRVCGSHEYVGQAISGPISGPIAEHDEKNNAEILAGYGGR